MERRDIAQKYTSTIQYKTIRQPPAKRYVLGVVVAYLWPNTKTDGHAADVASLSFIKSKPKSN